MIVKYEDGTFCISSRGCWIPGVYDSEATARRAIRRTNEQLQCLQDTANTRNGGTGGVITGSDLDALRGKQ